MNKITDPIICEFKINVFILIDFNTLIQNSQKSQSKEYCLVFQYVDLVFYDSLLAVENYKKQRLNFNESEYLSIQESWTKKIAENPLLNGSTNQFSKNKMSLIFQKFQILENLFNFNISNLKQDVCFKILNVYTENFNFKDFCPLFQNKFDALVYYGILVKNLISHSTINDFQIIKNSIQIIINEINSINNNKLIQLSHVWKNIANLLSQNTKFDFKNLEILIDLEKQIQKNLKNDQKHILSFKDQIAFILDNIKRISFSDAANSDFLKLNCELKMKSLFYQESEQKIKKTIKYSQIQRFIETSQGEAVLKVLLKPFTSSSTFVELQKPQEFHKFQTVSSVVNCQRSLLECNSITQKLMGWMSYFQEFSQTSYSAKKTITCLLQVLKTFCSEYPLAVQHIVQSNFHFKLLDITYDLQSCPENKKNINDQQASFSSFLLSQDYAFYEIGNCLYSSSSLCIKTNLIQYLISTFQENCIQILENKIEDENNKNRKNKCIYIQNQIMQLLVDIPKNLSQPVALQILQNCQSLFLKYSPSFVNITSLLNLYHLALNFLIQSIYPESLYVSQNLLKIRYQQFLSFNQSIKDKEEILRMRNKICFNKMEQYLNLQTIHQLPFLEQYCLSKFVCDESSENEIDQYEIIEESKVEDIDVQHDQQMNIENQNSNQQEQIKTDQTEARLNLNFNYDLKNVIKQRSFSQQNASTSNLEKIRNQKYIQEILIKFPVFNTEFFESIFENLNQNNISELTQLLISLMNHPWNCMEILNIVFRQSFNTSNQVQENLQYNQLVEIALKNSLMHYPLSKGFLCKKTNQIVLCEQDLEIDFNQNIFDMEQIPLIQILLRSPQFSKIQENAWMMVKNDSKAEFPYINQKVVINQCLIDMISSKISPQKYPQIMMNIISNQGQIMDVVKYMTIHLEETRSSEFIYYTLLAFRKVLEKFIQELSHDEFAIAFINQALSSLRDWILSRKEFMEQQLNNMFTKCTSFIQDQVSKFYPMRQDQMDDIDIDLENVSKNFQVLWRIITNTRKEIKMDIQALAEVNLILNYDFHETGQLPMLKQRKVSNEISMNTSLLDKKNLNQVNTNQQQYHSEDEFSEDFLISKLASMNELTRKSSKFERKLWEFFEQISETLGPEIIGRDAYIHLLNLLKPSLKKSELMRHIRSVVYGNQFTFAKQSKLMNVVRDDIWNSTHSQMKEYKNEEWLRAVFQIRFKSKIGEHLVDEIGIDAGGLKNHWIAKIVEQTFLNNKDLFTYTPDQTSLYPNRNATSVKQLEEFEILGKFVGKAMMDDWPLMISFAPFFVKQVLKRDLNIGDFYTYDYKTAQQHEWLLENDIDDLDLGLTFSYTIFCSGQTKVIDLIKNGQNIDVTDANKKEYVQLYCKAKMQDEIALQTQSFSKGLFSIVPEDALEALETEDFISFYQGVQNVDVTYLKSKMKYEGFKSTDLVIEWFWEILQEWDNNQRKKFLSALTEIPGVPVGGYPVRDVATGNVKQLTITYLNNNPESLPIWHTCFFRIDIPKYNSKEQMKMKIEQSMDLSCGFHIA